MVDDKNDTNSIKSKKYQDKFTPQYRQALNRIDKLDRKFALAMEAMDTVDKDSAMSAIGQQTKEMVRYEMAVRLGLEKHRVLDTLYAPLSSVLDVHSAIDGKPIPCPGCHGDGINRKDGIKQTCYACQGNKVLDDNIPCPTCDSRGGPRCTFCGGIGKMVNHELSLSYKILYSIGDLTRSIHAMMGGTGGHGPVGEVPREALEPAFEEMRKQPVEGAEAYEALQAMTTAMNIPPEAGYADQFMKMYIEYCAEKGTVILPPPGWGSVVAEEKEEEKEPEALEDGTDVDDGDEES